MGFLDKAVQFASALTGSNGEGSGLRRWPRVARLPGCENAEQSRLALLQTVFPILGHVAAADGQIPQKNHSAYQQFARKSFGCSQHEELLAFQLMFRASRGERSIETLLQKLKSLAEAQPIILEQMLEAMIYVAAAPGEKRPEADQLIAQARKVFGISEVIEESAKQAAATAAQIAGSSRERGNRASEKLKQKIRGVDYDPYAILGCARDAANEAIKARYKELVLVMHPDRLRAAGKSEPEIADAREQFARVLKAYAQIRKEKNFS